MENLQYCINWFWLFYNWRIRSSKNFLRNHAVPGLFFKNCSGDEGEFYPEHFFPQKKQVSFSVKQISTSSWRISYMEYVYVLVMNKNKSWNVSLWYFNLLDDASFSAWVLSKICPIHDKSKIKFAYKSLMTSLVGWKLPGEFMRIKFSLEDYIVS